MAPSKKLQGFEKLIDVVRQLRDPDSGCPWDLKQTHQSLRPYVLEEAYEMVEAIDSGDLGHLKEELGDVLLQVVLHAQLATDAGNFTADEVADAIAEKLIRRHPHVFSTTQVENAEEVTANWEKIKAAEKGGKPRQSAMDDISSGQPALLYAYKASKRAVGQGFEWPDFESLWACVMSEFDEFRQEIDQKAPFEKLEDEMGDILFATVNLSRYNGINPEVALHKATRKFMTRYRTMERLGEKPISQMSFEEMDALWNRAKQVVKDEGLVNSGP